MSSKQWIVKSHIIAASYPREFLRSTKSPNARLQLVVNQYVPIKNQTPSPGDVTIIVAHANAFHKELYEPFFDDLLTRAGNAGFKIRSIWAPDAAHQGESGVLNEEKLGDDPCWNDFARDILQLATHFSSQMPSPRFGIGHSMGGQAIFECALRNPALFTAIIGIDPVIHQSELEVFPRSNHPAHASAKRKDLWRTRAEAETYFRSRPFYRTWDPRVLDLHIKHGLRQLPTALYPVPPNDPGAVTLTTTKHQEVLTFLRPDPNDPNEVYRPEPSRTYGLLPHIKIPILYVFGGKSVVSSPNAIKTKMEKNPNNAAMVTLEGAGHLIPQEMPDKTADVVSEYLGRLVKLWSKQAEKHSSAVGQIIYPDLQRRLFLKL